MSPYVQCLLVFVFLYTAILVYGWRTVDRPSRRVPEGSVTPQAFFPGARRDGRADSERQAPPRLTRSVPVTSIAARTKRSSSDRPIS